MRKFQEMVSGLGRLPDGSAGKESAYNAGDLGSIPGSGRCPGGGNGNPLQYSCLGNSINGGAWWSTVHGITKELGTTQQLTSSNIRPQGNKLEHLNLKHPKLKTTTGIEAISVMLLFQRDSMSRGCWGNDQGSEWRYCICSSWTADLPFSCLELSTD